MTVEDRLDHDRLEEAVAAYLLDALDEDERGPVGAHIEGCPSCRALMSQLSPTVDALPVSVDDVRPPDRLRDRILAAAAVTPAGREPRRTATPRIIPLPLRPSQDSRRAAVAGVRGRRLRLAANAAAVAVLIAGVGVLGAVSLNLQNQLRHAQEQARRVPPQPSPGEYQMNGTGSLAGAGGQVTTLPGQTVALVSLDGLPQVPANKVYQLWVIEKGKNPASAGVFTPDRFGTYTLVLKTTLKAGTILAITVENGPTGAPQPTQTPQLTGQL